MALSLTTALRGKGESEGEGRRLWGGKKFGERGKRGAATATWRGLGVRERKD